MSPRRISINRPAHIMNAPTTPCPSTCHAQSHIRHTQTWLWRDRQTHDRHWYSYVWGSVHSNSICTVTIGYNVPNVVVRAEVNKTARQPAFIATCDKLWGHGQGCKKSSAFLTPELYDSNLPTFSGNCNPYFNSDVCRAVPIF